MRYLAIQAKSFGNIMTHDAFNIQHLAIILVNHSEMNFFLCELCYFMRWEYYLKIIPS